MLVLPLLGMAVIVGVWVAVARLGPQAPWLAATAGALLLGAGAGALAGRVVGPAREVAYGAIALGGIVAAVGVARLALTRHRGTRLPAG